MAIAGRAMCAPPSALGTTVPMPPQTEARGAAAVARRAGVGLAGEGALEMAKGAVVCLICNRRAPQN